MHGNNYYPARYWWWKIVLKFLSFHGVCFYIRKSGFSRQEDCFSIFKCFIRKEPRSYKFTLVAFTSRVSERSFWIYMQNTRASTDFMSNIRKTTFWRWYFLLKIETIVSCISIIIAFSNPTEKYGWGLNAVLSKWSYRYCLIINWMPKLFLMQWWRIITVVKNTKRIWSKTNHKMNKNICPEISGAQASILCFTGYNLSKNVRLLSRVFDRELSVF